MIQKRFGIRCQNYACKCNFLFLFYNKTIKMYLHFICRVINLYCWQVKTIILCYLQCAPSLPSLLNAYLLTYYFQCTCIHTYVRVRKTSIMFAFAHYYYYLPSLFILVRAHFKWDAPAHTILLFIFVCVCLPFLLKKNIV